MLTDELRHFDAGRAMLEDYLDGFPARLMVTESQSFQEAFARGKSRRIHTCCLSSRMACCTHSP